MFRGSRVTLHGVFSDGVLVAGKYRIDRRLGRGGMGVVVAATHIHLRHQVALKFLEPAYASNPKVVERFVREARAAAGLRGEHVCRVSDVGALDDGTPFIVMELLDGTDLSQLLRSGGALPVQRACSYVLQACIGVGEAHALGIVHRDLKPANLFLARRPDGTPLVKVLDFGIAKAPAGSDNSEFSLTQTTGVLGSPGYMSPEQLRSSHDVDLRTDIWSLGVILYELVSGRPPFTAESVTELAIRVWMDARPPFVGSMPDGFDHVIDRCLAKKPDDRYPDLANLAHALAVYAGSDGWDLANSVSRLLKSGPLLASGPGDPAMGSSVAPTVPPTAFAHPAAVPTTLGSSAVSLISAPPVSPRRWVIPAMVAAVAIGIGAAVAIVHTGRATIEPAIESPIAKPTPHAIDAELPDAAAVATAAPADAAEPVADAAQAAAVPVDAPAKKKTGHKTSSTEDYGESRY